MSAAAFVRAVTTASLKPLTAVTTATAMIPMITAYSAKVWPRSSRAESHQTYALASRLLSRVMSDLRALDVCGGVGERCHHCRAQGGHGCDDRNRDDADDDRVLGEGLSLFAAKPQLAEGDRHPRVQGIQYIHAGSPLSPHVIGRLTE